MGHKKLIIQLLETHLREAIWIMFFIIKTSIILQLCYNSCSIIFFASQINTLFKLLPFRSI